MSHGRTPSARALRAVGRRAVAVELAVVVAALVALAAYVNLTDAAVRPVRDVVAASTGIDRHLVRAAAQGSLVLGGVGGVAAWFAAARDVSLPLSVPDREAGSLLGAAAVGAAVLAAVPLVPAALTYGVGVDHLSAALANAPANLADRTLVSVAVFVSGMALLYQGLVQGAFGRVLGRERAAAATALASAYFATPRFVSAPAAVRSGPWLHVTPERAAVAALFVLGLAVAVYADRRVDDRRARAAALLPVALAVALAALSVGRGIDGPLELLTPAARVALVGVAAYAYVGTRSLLAPALAYLSYALASVVVNSAALYALVGA
ncbi:hypothetical protein [Halosimplex marinum]|uniref:hypothetical protein n=1 Tax=Halosimplex marinum TaxID=3396620 RepID=UPI003F54FCCA